MIRDPKEEYVEELVERLRDANLQGRRYATAALARLGREAVPALIEALQDEDWNVRRHAAAALAESPDSRSLPLLCELLTDVDWEVRREAARALRAAASPSTIGSLPPALRDRHPQVRLYAAEALLAIQRKDPHAVADVWPEVLPCIGALLADAERRVQPVAATLAGNIGDARTISDLWRVLESGTGEPELRLAVVEALGKIRTDRCVEPLRIALSDRDQQVRAQAALCLGEIPGDAAIWHLVRILDSADPLVRLAAATALGCIARSRPVPALRAALTPLRHLIAPALWVVSPADHRFYRQTLRAIETATADMADLPMPAAAAGPEERLPIPASVSMPEPLETRPIAPRRFPRLIREAWRRVPDWLLLGVGRGKASRSEDQPDG